MHYLHIGKATGGGRVGKGYTPTCLQGHPWDLYKTDEKNLGWGPGGTPTKVHSDMITNKAVVVIYQHIHESTVNYALCKSVI